MPDPVNVVAQLWLWRLELRVVSALLTGAVIVLTLVLYALGVPMAVGLGIGLTGLAALFLYGIGLMAYSLLFPDRVAAKAFDRADREHKAILADYGPGWEQRRLAEDQARWRQEGRWDLLADYGIHPEQRSRS